MVAAFLTKVVWIQSLLSKLRIPFSKPKLYSDNLGTLLLRANLVMHSKNKHFELDLVSTITNTTSPSSCSISSCWFFDETIFENLFLHVGDKLMVVTNPTMSLRGLRIPIHKPFVINSECILLVNVYVKYTLFLYL